MFDKIILGTVQFGLNYGINNSLGKPSQESVFEILDFAYEKGIRVLDTAEAYGNSHAIIAAYHKERTNRFRIMTKYKKGIVGLENNLVKRVKEHLNVFDVDYLEAYSFHDINEFLEFANSNENQLLELIDKNLVKKIGVSVYTNEQLEMLLSYEYVKIVQLPFNLFDNAFQREKTLQKVHAKGIEVHTRSAFLQGLFFIGSDNLSVKLNPLKEAHILIQEICKEELLKMEVLALNYPLSKSYIDAVLIGVDTVEQLESNLNSISIKIPDTIYKRIDDIMVKEKEMLNPSNW